MKTGTEIRKGQTWRSRDGGFVVEIDNRASGDVWNVKRGRVHHHMSKFTLWRYYELVTR